jgi:hypothetical protein
MSSATYQDPVSKKEGKKEGRKEGGRKEGEKEEKKKEKNNLACLGFSMPNELIFTKMLMTEGA